MINYMMTIKEIIETIDLRTLIAIKRQAEYDRTVKTEHRLKIVFGHLEGLKQLQREAERL